MPREHRLAGELARRELVELRVRAEEEDQLVDAYFADARGDRLHLCFIGVKDLRVSRLQLGAMGYRLYDVRGLGKPDRTVHLVPPKGRGAALFARVVMAID